MATFETLAAKCAAGAALDLLVAIASIESGVHPLVVRHGTTLTRIGSAGEGVAVAVAAADQGREVRVGLMGLTERQLRAAGLPLYDGFDACASLSAAAGIIATARVNSDGPSSDAATTVALRAWWRADGRFASVSAFEAAIVRERAAASVLAKREVASSAPRPLVPPGSNAAAGGEPLAVAHKRHTILSAEPECWDIFARQRAGVAQCEDHRVTRPESFMPEPRPRQPEPETASIVIFGSREMPR